MSVKKKFLVTGTFGVLGFSCLAASVAGILWIVFAQTTLFFQLFYAPLMRGQTPIDPSTINHADSFDWIVWLPSLCIGAVLLFISGWIWFQNRRMGWRLFFSSLFPMFGFASWAATLFLFGFQFSK
jgi:hypothetical protein